MKARNRMLDDEELFAGMMQDDSETAYGSAPQKTIGRIEQTMLDGPSASQPGNGRLSLDQLSQTYDEQGGVWGVNDPNAMLSALLKQAGYSGDAFDRSQEWVMQGDSGMVQQDKYTPSAGAQAALDGYSFTPQNAGDINYVDAFNKSGGEAGRYKFGEDITAKDVLGDAAKIAAIAGGLNFASGGFGGMFGEAASGGLSAGAVDSAAAGLDAGLMGGSSGFGGGLSAGAIDSAAAGLDAVGGAAEAAPSWLSSVPSEVEASIQQAAFQSPAQVAATAPNISNIPMSPGASGLDLFRQQELSGYQTNGSMPSSPAVAAQPAAPVAPQESGLDQFRQNELAGYQTNGTMPSSPAVPMGQAAPPDTGLSQFRQNELAGYETNGALPTSPAVPTGTGGLLGGIKAGGSQALDWMKANPGLAKLMLGGATSLLSAQGNASGGAQKSYGPPVQWKSQIQPLSQGILGGQMGGQSSGYPKAMGLMGGNANSGAWRFLGG